MEAVARLSPPGVGDILPLNKLIFRRTRHTIAWLNGGQENADQTDDTSDKQVRDLEPQGNDTLYDVDLPGQRAQPTYHSTEMYANFVQKVMFVCGETEILCSNEAPWSYQNRLDYDKPGVNKVDLNLLAPTHIVLPTTPFYSPR